MDEKEKVPPTSEPNPNEGNQVNASDLENEKDGQGGQTKPTGEENQEGQPKQEEGGKPNGQAKQDRKTDAQYAEERRQRKAREEARQKAREEEIRRQAVFEVKSGQVTADELKELDLDKVENEDQLFLVESLRKAKAEGVENPQAEAYKALFKKQAADRAQAQAKSQAEEQAKQKKIATVAQDQANFKAKFGKTTAEVMKSEPEFMQIFGNLIDPDKGNFTELYTAYTSMKEEQSKAAKGEGSFPTDSSGSAGKGGAEESDEDFRKRYIAEHGHW